MTTKDCDGPWYVSAMKWAAQNHLLPVAILCLIIWAGIDKIGTGLEKRVEVERKQLEVGAQQAEAIKDLANAINLAVAQDPAYREVLRQLAQSISDNGKITKEAAEAIRRLADKM